MGISILAGDIGGTNARFAYLDRPADGGWDIRHFTKVKCSDYPTFEAALQSYIESVSEKPTHIAICAAGPVEDGYINLTHTDWQISAKRLKRIYGLKRCGLYNDFSGMTRSIPELGGDDFTIIRSGDVYDDAPILVAGPGTGFGAGYLVPFNRGGAKSRHVIAAEGGHISYSPQTHLEFELLLILQRDRDFVPVELVSSGRALPLIHKAICEIHDKPYKFLEPDKIRDLARSGDVIALDICTIRAAATMGAIGDLALSGGARGGIVLAGGVSERMIEFYMKPEAMNRYLRRGTHSDYVKTIPMRLLKSPYAPLIGSAALLKDRT